MDRQRVNQVVLTELRFLESTEEIAWRSERIETILQ